MAFFILKKNRFQSMCMYVSAGVTCVQYPQRPEGGTESLRIRVTGSCEPPEEDAGNPARVVSTLNDRAISPASPPIFIF